MKVQDYNILGTLCAIIAGAALGTGHWILGSIFFALCIYFAVYKAVDLEFQEDIKRDTERNRP